MNLCEEAISIARFWPVFPVRRKFVNKDRKDKEPLISGGFHSATQDEQKIRTWWHSFPNADIAIPTGSVTGLQVFDIDPRHGGDDSLSELIQKFGPLPNSVEVQTQSGGRHLYYQWDGETGIGTDLFPGIDVRGEGGYVVVPPSIGNSGRGYIWETSSHPEDTELAPVPVHFTRHQGAIGGEGGNLAGFVAGEGLLTDEPAPEGKRNQTLTRLVGRWLHSNEHTMQEIESMAIGWNETNDSPLDKSEVLRTVRSMIKTHTTRNPTATIVMERQTVTEMEPPRTPIEKHAFPNHLLYPSGAVGQIARWIVESSYKPQPVLALGASLAFWGALLGRRVALQNIRTNLYILGVANSCSGKERPRSAIKKLCEEAGIFSELLGAEEVTGDAAIINEVRRKKSLLYLWDEIGHMLTNINASKNASWLAGIPKILTILYTCADSMWTGKSYADTVADNPIDQPHVAIYGSTVPNRLATGLTSDQIRDGFFGRFLVFRSDDPDPMERDSVPADDPPAEIVEHIRRWWAYRPVDAAGNISQFVKHKPDQVEITEAANNVFKDFNLQTRKKKEHWRLKDKEFDSIWGRAVENAKKIALIISCGFEPDQKTVTEEIARYAVELTDFLVNDAIGWTEVHVAENEHEKNFKRICEIIRLAGAAGISKREIIQKTRRLSSRDRDEILKGLEESETVQKLHVTIHKKPAAYFRYMDGEHPTSSSANG